MPPPRTYWFPAKRYGFGWGLPCAWPGWVVLVVYFVLSVAIQLVLPIGLRLREGLIGNVVLSLLLLAVMWRKGEPPRWRWGDRDR